MALGANFHVQRLFRGSRRESIAASALNASVGIIFWVNVFLHAIIVPLNFLLVKMFSRFSKSVPLVNITVICDFLAAFEAIGSKGTFMPGVHFLRFQKTVTDTPYVYLQGNYWAEPSIPHLQETMRQVYENAAAEKAAAEKTGAKIRKDFSWVEVTKPIKARIEDIYKNKLVGVIKRDIV